MTHALLAPLALFARRHYRGVFVAFGLLVALALVAVSRLSFDTDVLKLLPQDEPVVQQFIENVTRFGNIDYLLIGIRIPEGEVLAPYQTFADRLAERIGRLPEIKSVEHRISNIEELLERFAPKAVLFTTDRERAELEARVSDAGIRRRVQEIRRLLGTPQGLAMRDLLTLDPFGLAEVFLDRLEGSRGQLSIDWQSGYNLSQDHTLLLILAEPSEPPQSVEFGERLTANVEQAAAEIIAQWPQITGFAAAEGDGGAEEVVLEGETPPPPTVALGGSYLTTVDEARFIRRDVIINIATSIVLVFGLFLLAFRRLGPLVYAIVPLASGLVLTFGFAALVLGKLSTATSGTAALLIGLGIDFVIVSYARFVEERKLGKSLDDALTAMAALSGRAVVVGAVTTTATFYAFMITDFRGLWEMGFLTGTGILFCMVSVLLLLPALLAWHESGHARRETEPSFYLHSFGTTGLIRFALDRPWTVMAVGAAVTVAALFFATGLEFEENMRAMRPKGNRGIEVAEEIAEKFGSGFHHMILVISGDTAGEVLERTDEAVAAAQPLLREGILYRIDSVASLIPPPKRQREVLDWLARERSDGLDVERIRATFRQALAAEGLRPEPFEGGVELFAEAISPTEPLGLDDFAGSEETRRLLSRYVHQVEDGWKSLVYLSPPRNRYRREPPPEAVELAERLGPEVLLTGNNVLNYWVRQRVKRDAWLAGILGFVLVGILIYFDFHRLRDVFAALTPLVVGIVWMLGAMAALGIDLNFMNIFVTTMIIGIGVDYGLHILHRYREVDRAPEAEFRHGIYETGKAILLAALSTLCGFGSMSISHYPGLRSTGYVAVMGALGTAVVAITLLPAWFEIRRRRRQRLGQIPL